MPKYHLVSGGCGFVGRHIVGHLLQHTPDYVLVVDDLSVGLAPERWHHQPLQNTQGELQFYGPDSRMIYWKGDFRILLRRLTEQPDFLRTEWQLPIERFADVFHFAAIVGGRAKIDGDPMAVALDLSIDAEFFYWAVRHKPQRVMFPSSSAAYPINMQGETGAVALAESDIRFDSVLGQPDMTYGWSKLTGEYLAQIAAQYYGLHVACVRPFSGYGEDQDLSYPVPAIARRAARRENPFEVWGSGQQGRDFVHIDDCIDAIMLALDKISDGRAINIGSGKLTSFLDLIQLFSSFVGYSPDIKPLLDKPVGVANRYANMDWVNNELGWKPKISLEAGMRRVYEAQLKQIAAEK